MASRTANTLFCREEMRDFDQFKPQSKSRFQIQTEGLVYLLAGLRLFSPGTSYSGSMRSLKRKLRAQINTSNVEGPQSGVILTPGNIRQ